MDPRQPMRIVLLVLVTFTSHSLSAQVQNNNNNNDGICYCLTNLVNQIPNPVATVFFKEDGVDRMVVVAQQGTANVYDVKTNAFVRVFLDIRDRVFITDTVGDSRGLLSLVLDPVYEANHKVYVYYIREVDNAHWAYVSSFTTVYGAVDRSTERTLLRVYQPYQHANGGPMLFGDDGYLYIVTGDGNSDENPDDRAQDLNAFHGKVLRIDVDGQQSFTSGESSFGKLYGVPDSNPYSNTNSSTTALEEVYASGIRNIWGCSQDTARLGGTGRIFCAETGTDMSDEINIIESGANYGWPLKEGSHCRQGNNCTGIANEGIPIHEFHHISQHALVGGFVYRGDDFPDFNASAMYAYADVVNGDLYVLEEENATGPWKSMDWPYCGEQRCPSTAKDAPRNYILAIGQDLQGELYLMMSDSFVATQRTAGVYRVGPPNPSSGPSLTASLWLLAVPLLTMLWSSATALQGC